MKMYHLYQQQEFRAKYYAFIQQVKIHLIIN